MLKTCTALLISLFFLTNCKKSDDAAPPAAVPETEKDLAGTYQGYKFFNKSRKDSLAATIKIAWVTDKKLTFEEITPFKHTKQLEMTGTSFVFDRGTGEDDCGRIEMKGTGNFQGKALYVIETITCVKGNAPDKFVEYRVSRK